ncbi:DUF6054 family protein [Fusibacter sp. 3D3]|uniref:DUF6054 family protein n=1 Tax=Fusibacter sp. 3D3 TaxID=1048380 RepID=UPI0008529D32|nr:DUF6054 family protein [Fusibacter sp. 3D3]GAU76497.1 hypothetical protein F3D3_1094 [Fusibacter sp. 3D3]
MAKFEKTLIGEFDKITTDLHKHIMDSAVSMNLVDESHHEFGNTKVMVRAYDKYFMRNSSRASLSVTVVSDEEALFVSAIGSGGGQGIFFNFNWGAEDELVGVVAKFFNDYR